MKIYVKTLKGKPIEIEIEPTEKILKIKRFIEELQGIPPNVQKLYFFGEILDDDNILAYYNVQNEFTIHLKYLFRENMQIRIEIFSSSTKRNSMIKIEVKYTDNIIDIKGKIPNINANAQLYYFDKKLEDHQKLSDYNIQDDSIIHILE